MKSDKFPVWFVEVELDPWMIEVSESTSSEVNALVVRNSILCESLSTLSTHCGSSSTFSDEYLRRTLLYMEPRYLITIGAVGCLSMRRRMAEVTRSRGCWNSLVMLHRKRRN